MKKYTLLLLLILCLGSCTESLISNEQRKKYEECRKEIIENKTYYSNQLGDSLQQFHLDICDLSLDELVIKYNFTKEDIEPLIESICISSEVLNSIKKLELKLDDIDKVNFSNINELLDSFDLNSIKPVKFNPSEYISVGDTTN